MDGDGFDLGAAATRHGLSRSAAETLYRALVAGGGRQAQFSHPDLGGMGQWSGGMVQIGDMFNDGLKAKVGGFCAEMADKAKASEGRNDGAAQRPGDAAPTPKNQSRSAGSDWWPLELGAPASAGGQNGMRYACFPDRHRLAVEQDGRVQLYETGTHRLTGFAQQQGGGGAPLSFTGPDGAVTLDSLTKVER
ncbi:SHOCT domain-containing protein [Lichenihabitans sp. Uapishka_5]|uniref:SHOCT domain-containing protein n=1 Tax=Lichenihabitans sp. Uapishka_5 TaxID=3037302 RepID=UPI0029E7F809|nr:SHOCT domain-containing protein [Lichenihabitans sp. Uapishka_5]MDX7952955.1 SHOCT domain-containing protein [Lichenihabitans sp. Uapishka_5]